LNERTPFEHYTGHTLNITALCTYSFYDYCWFWDSEEGFLNQQRVLGNLLGVSHDIGGPLTYYVLPKSCPPIMRLGVTPVTPEELLELANKALTEELDKAINAKIGKFQTDKEVAEELGALFGPSGDLYDGDIDPFDEIEAAEEAALMPESDEWTPETFDKYLAAEALLTHGGELVQAKVTSQKRGADGTPAGVVHSNPILDTREYEVSFPNESTNCYVANMIAESLYSQVDTDGREFMLMKEIMDHQSDRSAVPVNDAYYEDPNGWTSRRMTTKAGKFLLNRRTAQRISSLSKTTKNPTRFRSRSTLSRTRSLNSRHWHSQEAGADHPEDEDNIMEMHSQVRSELLKIVKQVLAIDRYTGTSFWKDAIEKEMKNVLPAF
jgi:hypothetical protein